MQNNKAAVFIILGQSNAVGHGIPMEQADKILLPLKNVFGLDRQFNQSFHNTKLTWTGYTSSGMNLAEEQDHTYSIPNCLASLWQKHIDDGNKLNLPDLYIIQIAIGGQGVSQRWMWSPERAEQLIPGKLGTVDISLFPFAKHIFSLLDDSFSKKNLDYEIMGLHWRGGEEDTLMQTEILSQTLADIYIKIFDTFNTLLHTPKTILHKLVCHESQKERDPSGMHLQNMHFINGVFEKLACKYQNIEIFDPSKAPHFIDGVRGNGIFMEDLIHFSPETNKWIAESILEKYCNI